MLLIVSDLHLGRVPENDAHILSDLRACVRDIGERGSGEPLEIVFLGDIFDAYIDYPGYRPERLSRFLRLAREFQDGDIEIHIQVGNHDRWHASTMEDELGVSPVRTERILSVCSDVGAAHEESQQSVLVAHGDLFDAHGRLTAAARAVSDTWWARRLYTTFLPARVGNGLAAAVSRRFAETDPTPKTVDALRGAARHLLATREIDLVVFGHCHHAELTPLPGGAYLNTGDWFRSRTFGIVSETEAGLLRWTGSGTEELGRQQFDHDAR